MSSTGQHLCCECWVVVAGHSSPSPSSTAVLATVVQQMELQEEEQVTWSC